MKKSCYLLFLICGFAFSQNLEETIYIATETFIANQNSTSLHVLNKHESTFKNQVKTKSEQLALVFLQSNKGYYLDQHSKLKEAITTYEDVLKRFTSNNLSVISDFDVIESCLKPLGNLYTKTGDYTNAENTIKQYIFLAEKSKNIKHQVSGAINLSKLYYTLGKHETVLNITNNYINDRNINHTQKQKLININTDSKIVLNLISGANSNIPKIKNQAFEDYTNYKIELQKGNYKDAQILFKTYKSHLLKNELTSRRLTLNYIEEAQLHYLLKNTPAALKSLQLAIKTLLPNFTKNGLPSKNLLYAENRFIDIFDLYATLESNADIALQSYDLSFYVSNLLQDSWTSQEAKILNQTNNRIRSEKCINILFNTYNQTKNKSLLFKALQYSENNKAYVLNSAIQKKIRLQRFPNDTLLIKEFNLLQEQERITNLLIKEQLGSNQASKINALSIKISHISFQIKTLKTAISKKYPNSNTLLSSVVLKDKLLEDQIVLTEYFYGENNIYQFTISAHDISLNQIPLDENSKKDIINFIRLFDDASLINNDISNYTKQAFNIYKLLNFNTLDSHENIIIIPDGLLNFIPFEALLTETSNTISFSKMPFVVKKQNIAYNSSIFLYLNEAEQNSNNKVLGFFPVFKNTNQVLTHSVNEAQSIKKEMSSMMFMNTEATKSNFIKNAPKYDILHLSTHANSGSFTKPANISFYDDTILLNELYSLNLNANLVILSACETGIGKLYKGEGPMSIARGFQYAGAKNLIFSLWQINDLSTSQIMQLFYKNYNTSKSVFVANHDSKIQYLQNESISNIKKSPYYWGAFVFYGTPKSEKPYNIVYCIILGVFIVLIALFLTRFLYWNLIIKRKTK